MYLYPLRPLQVDDDGESYWVFESRDVRFYLGAMQPVQRHVLNHQPYSHRSPRTPSILGKHASSSPHQTQSLKRHLLGCFG